MARICSAVISAACQAIPDEVLDVPDEHDLPLLAAGAGIHASATDKVERFQQVVTAELKWGVVPGSAGQPSGNDLGHLAFGSKNQDIEDVVVGTYYAGDERRGV